MIDALDPNNRLRGPVALPPRLFTSSPLGSIANILSLVLAALVGAGVVHLLAYHVPMEALSANRWMADAGILLAHCPLVVPLGGLGLVALAALGLLLYELRRLRRLEDHLGRLDPLPLRLALGQKGRYVSRRSPKRLGVFIVSLIALQVPVLVLTQTAGTMPMTMPVAGTVPTTMPTSLHSALLALQGADILVFGALHLLVATLIGLLLWCVERRLIGLRVRVAYHLARLARTVAATAARPLSPRSLYPLSLRHGQVLFARPPPHTF